MLIRITSVVACLSSITLAHPDHHPWRPTLELPRTDPFARLDDADLPTPNQFRTASGAPGPAYWQQRADHDIAVRIDVAAKRLEGSETIHYVNNSPDTLTYLWVQLDQNRFRPDSRGQRSRTAPDLSGGMSYDQLRSMLEREQFDGGTTLHAVEDGRGNALEHHVAGTMMRVDMPEPLEPGRSFDLRIDWSHNIVPDVIGGRGAYETFDDGRTIFEIAQWYPRMAAYTDYDGWQTRPFLGRGEFTLEFGDYDVAITVPDTFVVGATGELQNARDVLTAEEQDRLTQARTSTEPVMVRTRDESDAAVASTASGEVTWRFHAENVRDFAFAASDAFAWDAMGVPIPGSDNVAMAMSLWPAEGDGLWERYSTHAIAHALESYSRTAMPYPWPTAWSINGPVGGMEYPMVTFNGPRPEDDGTWSSRSKYGLISVIIHEVGHFWFPMIVNSDERQWTWMDEGLNTYHQFIAQTSWEEDYPSRRGNPRSITPHMRDTLNTRPIMTASESILQFGSNAYAKPATALNILRETVVGRELFDDAMREYTRRWAFKRPEPADFFRTIEDATGHDLDWFWRGWFYSNHPVDISIEDVESFRVASGEPVRRKRADRVEEEESQPETVTEQRESGREFRTDRHPHLIDFYNEYDRHDVTPEDERRWAKLLEELEPEQAALLDTDMRFHVLHFASNGGIVMPIPLELTFEDGSTEELMLPADIWRADPHRCSTLIMRPMQLASVRVDPHDEIADAVRDDNRFPPDIDQRRFRLRQSGEPTNPMRIARDEEARRCTADAVASWAAVVASDPSLLLDQPCPMDGWHATMALQLPTPDETTVLARLISAGPDGLFGTPDDLSATMHNDGAVSALRTADERPRPRR
ncbi:MAG: M1 family metallopeptidase [Phycisphaerales bacterium]|nr:M1 family metallopeptidase [Phycisphaerales bacterium]